MNIVLQQPKSSKTPNGGGYYLIQAKRDGKVFIVSAVGVLSTGTICFRGDKFTLPSEREAINRATTMAKIKEKRRGYIRLGITEIPDGIVKLFVPSLDKQVSPDKLLEHITEAMKEVYVTLRDNFGIEDLFDVGVEYIGSQTELDKLSNTVTVFDKNGEARVLSVERTISIKPTEQAIEVLSKKRF